MAYIIFGTLVSEGKMFVESIHAKESLHESLDPKAGVEVADIPETPQAKIGKAYTLYVDPKSRTCFYEESDRPLTPEERTQTELAELREVVSSLTLTILKGGNANV